MTTPIRTKDTVYLLALCALCFFLQLGAVDVLDFNDALYAQVAREMYLRHDLIIPSHNGIPWFDKPPLALWCSAAAYALFGQTAFAARLPVAISATLLVLLTAWFGCRYFGRKAGLIAATILAISPIFFGTARQMTMDIHQSWWVGAAMVCFFLGYTGTSRRSGWWYYGAWIASGLGFLAKSFPGLLPLLAALVFVVIENRKRPAEILRRIWQAQLAGGLLVLAAVVLPWHLLAYRAIGQPFIDLYWSLHHVKLLNGSDFNHARPIYEYVKLLPAGFFPWGLFIPATLFQMSRREAWEQQGEGTSGSDRGVALRFVLVWAATIFLFFSAMTSKLVSYLLPMYPAAALLVGIYLQAVMEGRQRQSARALLSFLAILSLGLLVGVLYALRHIAGTPTAAKLYEAVSPDLLRFGIASLAVIAVGTTAAAVLMLRNRARLAVPMLVGSYVLFIGLAVFRGLPALQASMNEPLHALAREAAVQVDEGIPLIICIARPIRPSVYFYLPDRLFRSKQLQPAGTEEGIVPETGDIPVVSAFLARHPNANVLTDTKHAPDLLAAHPNLVLIGQRERWRLYGTRTATARNAPNGLDSTPTPAL